MFGAWESAFFALVPLLLTGGPLPLLVAGSVLIPLAWAFLARDSKSLGAARSGPPSERLWLRLFGGAALGEVSVYLATALLSVGRTGSLVPLLIPFVLPAPLLLGTILGAVCGAASSRRHWRAEGVAAYLGLGFLGIGFLEYSLMILETTRFGPSWGLALFFLATELVGLVLLMLYQFYALEFLAGWTPGDAPPTPPPPERWPTVAVQIACYNEPFELVEECVRSVRALDYPANHLRIQLLDDSTNSAVLPQLEALCTAQGVEYRHRLHRRGFKAGALNDGLAALPADVELVAIVDADYRVDPTFLKKTVPHFRAPDVAWVQTPQSYWNSRESPFTRLYSLADAYFYHVIQPVRHLARSSIFCGTMGILRRRAVEDVGGWDEQCITEDAEISLRIYAAGWRSVYLTEALGAGLAPDHFPALRSQFSRWAFGGLQLLRRNRPALRSAKLTFRQRADFLLSGVFWMDGLFLFAMAGGLLALLAASYTGLTWTAPPPALLLGVSLTPVLLVADGIVKTRLALGRVHSVTLRDATGVMGFWYALKLTNLRAAFRGATGRSMSFARTPKGAADRGRVSWFSLLRPTLVETVLAIGVGLAALAAALTTPPSSLWSGFSRTVLVAWLGYYAMVFGAAPLLSLVARPGSSAPRDRTAEGSSSDRVVAPES